MHSSTLRGSDFEIVVDSRPQPHAKYFRGFSKTERLGLFAPNRTDGAGAINLVMAYVTAFYDDYRADGGDFKAYPDFFVFQNATPMADYAMYDLWPDHKLVHVEQDPTQVLRAITDRGVNVLLVPDGDPADHEFDAISLASARRNIDRCYVYAFEGRVDNADLAISCARSPFVDWVQNMFNTLKEDPEVQKRHCAWLAQRNDNRLKQSYRRLSLDEALARL